VWAPGTVSNLLERRIRTAHAFWLRTKRSRKSIWSRAIRYSVRPIRKSSIKANLLRSGPVSALRVHHCLTSEHANFDFANLPFWASLVET